MIKLASFRRLVVLLSLGVVFIGLTSLPARAVPITHVLTVVETAPGSSVSVGTFVIDSAALTPNTFIPLSSPSFLSFSITVLGQTFTLADALTPLIDGVMTDASAAVVSFVDSGVQAAADFVNGGGAMLFLFEPPSTSAVLMVGSAVATGNYSIEVPAPGTIPVFGVGLISLAWLLRRRRRPA